jgi:tagatose-6-phosphate ketose/aldose isomerase
LARESALKGLELTAGRTATSWDSVLGFRHGPKAAIIRKDLVVAMIHPDPHATRYDADVAKEIRDQFPDAAMLTVGGEGADIALGEVSDARWTPFSTCYRPRSRRDLVRRARTQH